MNKYDDQLSVDQLYQIKQSAPRPKEPSVVKSKLFDSDRFEVLIKSLAESSGMEYDLISDDEGTVVYVTEDTLKQFASKIVQRCAEICREQPNEYAIEFDRENCAQAIETYFAIGKK